MSNDASLAHRLSRALGSFAWPAIEAVLAEFQPPEGAPSFLVRRVIESGAWIVKHGGTAACVLRDDCFASAVSWLRAHGASDDVTEVTDHINGLRTFEVGYDAVLEEMERGPHEHLTPDVHVWTLVSFGRHELQVLEVIPGDPRSSSARRPAAYRTTYVKPNGA
jgi:hypothetical protein